jgi:hypothetical protein
MALRIATFIHGGSVFRTVIILLGIDSPAKSRQTSARDWWKSASQLVGRNSNNSVIPPLNCSNNIVYDDAEKAEAFNTFFSIRSRHLGGGVSSAGTDLSVSSIFD